MNIDIAQINALMDEIGTLERVDIKYHETKLATIARRLKMIEEGELDSMPEVAVIKHELDAEFKHQALQLQKYKSKLKLAKKDLEYINKETK